LVGYNQNSDSDLSDAVEENGFYPHMRQVKLMRWQDIEIGASHHERMLLVISDSDSDEVKRGEI
jgi:hypothetical protein